MKMNVGIRALLLQSEDAQTLKANDAAELRQTRILSVANPFASSFQLFAKRIILWQPKAPLAVLIEDEYLAAMFKEIFEKLWEGSKSS